MVKYLKYSVLILQRRFAFNYKKWLFSFVGSLLGISGIYIFHYWLGVVMHLDLVMLIGSFGASAVIIFGTPHSPYALPRHAIGGHIISAFIGLLIFKFLVSPEYLWLCCALAVALSVFVMQLSHTTHPPGGATALIAILGTNKVHSLGFWFMLSPVLSGILILLAISALLRLIFRHFKLII